MRNLNHFAPGVPEKTRRKLLEIAESVKENIMVTMGWKESFGSARIDEISGNPLPGFIPLQAGGYEVTEFFRSDTDSSYHFTPAQTKHVTALEHMLYKQFQEDHPELKDDWSFSELPEELQEEFSNTEAEWFEPALLRFEIWSGGEHGGIFMRLSVNYTDAPYYRASKGEETLIERNFKPGRLPSAEQIIELLTAALEEPRKHRNQKGA